MKVELLEAENLSLLKNSINEFIEGKDMVQVSVNPYSFVNDDEEAEIRYVACITYKE